MPESLTVAHAYHRNYDDGRARTAETDVRKVVELHPSGHWRPGKAKPQANAYSVSPVEVADIHEVRDALAEISSDDAPNNATLIYGQLNAHGAEELEDDAHYNQIGTVPRRKTHFEDVPRHVHFLDLDTLLLPEGYGVFEPLERLGHWLRAQLPPEFHDATLIVQATASHGCTSLEAKSVRRPRLRVVMWLRDPIPIVEYKRYVSDVLEPHLASCCEFDGKAAADLSIYSPERLILTLPPRAIGGTFPVRERLVVIEGGRDEVELPPLPELEEPEPIAPGEFNIAPASSDGELIGAMVPGNVHEPLTRLMARIGRRHEGNEDDLKRAISDILPALHERLRAISDGEKDRVEEHGGAQRLYSSARAIWGKPYEVVGFKKPKGNPKGVDAQRALVRRLMNSVAAYVKSEAWAESRPCHYLMTAPPGLGKSTALREVLTPGFVRSHPTTLLSPTIKLSDEQHAALAPSFQETPEEISVFRGWHSVCTNNTLKPIMQQASKAGIGVKSICALCDKREICAFPNINTDAPLKLMQHAHASTTLQAHYSSEVSTAASFTVFDESITGAFLKDSKPRRELRELIEAIRKPLLRQVNAPLEVFKYTEFLFDVLCDNPGSVSRQSMLYFNVRHAEGQTHMSRAIMHCANAIKDVRKALQRKLEKRAKEVLETGDAPTPEQVRKLAACLDALRYFLNMLRTIKCSLDIPARRHIMNLKTYLHLGRVKVQCHALPKLPGYMRETPALFMDGTARPGVYEAMLWHLDGKRPELSVMGVEVEPEHYCLTQFADRPYGKAMFTQADTAHGNSNLNRLHRFITARAFEHEQVLVICQGDVRKLLEEQRLPKNVAIEHFNALRGINTYKDVPCAIIVGRPAAQVSDVEMMASALHAANKGVIHVHDVPAGKWPTATDTVQMRDGMLYGVRVERHPDPDVDDVRHSVSDAEVIQAIARLRLYDRTPETKAHLYVFGTTQTGLKVDELKSWLDVNATLAEVQALSGIAFKSAETVRMAYPTFIGRGGSARKGAKEAYEVLKEAGVQTKCPNPLYICNIIGKWTDSFEGQKPREIEFRLYGSTSGGRIRKKERALVFNDKLDDVEVADAISALIGSGVCEVNMLPKTGNC